MPYRLVVKETREPVADVTAEQVQTLIDLLEEEDSADRDYYIDEAVLTYMAEKGADPALLALLRSALPMTGGIEVEWLES